ncbi:hypothetical protein [Marinobacter subterrani]|uniref:hypothetical protein n=1 Tax=Marinobacter subterrani TaxID=1658765 RepID=UPI00235568BE|nr:hypothetical protein [Marinobacter subterrani]
MKHFKMLTISVALACAVPLTAAFAADDQKMQDGMGKGMQSEMNTQIKDQDGKPVFGYPMMTPEERREFHTKMQSLDSVEDRQALREEHRQEMIERARAKGMTVEDIENLPATAAGKEKDAAGAMGDDKGNMMNEGAPVPGSQQDGAMEKDQ